VSRNARREIAHERWIFLHTKIVLVYRGYVSTAQAATADGDEDIVDCRAGRRRTGSLQALLAEGRSNEVVALSRSWSSRNSELEKQLAQVLSGGERTRACRVRSSSSSWNPLEKLSDEPRAGQGKAADQKLRDSSAIDQKEEKQTKPPKQPSLRNKPAPPHLRRIENLIWCRPGNGACPKCGKERDCHRHEVTEVIELIPAEWSCG